MSINLGFYDFFSYLLPGFLYLYVINEFLRILGLRSIDLNTFLQAGQDPALGQVALGLFGAYVAGHIFDPISLKFFFHFLFRLRNPAGATTISLQTITERYPKLGIRFAPKDWEVLHVILRQRSPETVQNIDRYQADSIMLRNIAFGALLLALLNVVIFFSTLSAAYLIVAILGFLACWVLASESFKFRIWFFTNIFEGSLLYGTNVEDVLSYETRNNIDKNKIQKQKVKKL